MICYLYRRIVLVFRGVCACAIIFKFVCLFVFCCSCVNTGICVVVCSIGVGLCVSGFRFVCDYVGVRVFGFDLCVYMSKVGGRFLCIWVFFKYVYVFVCVFVDIGVEKSVCC